jgi:geranylgeranyl pyrophosphate synthase
MPQSSAQLMRQPDLETQKHLIDLKLIDLLSAYPHGSDELKEAAIYSVGSTGHRWRPILFTRVYEKLTVPAHRVDVLPLACAIEFLHTASLVLDDLPCMDDATVRRGREACHIKFGQSRTVLASHWLCDVAQHYLQDFAPFNIDLENAFRKTKTDMMNGQILDLENTYLKENEIVEKCRLNSGSLYGFSASAPAIISNAGTLKRTLQKFGEYLGTAYQIADDIADVTSTSEVLGKNVRQDKGKRTLPALCGVERAKVIHESYKKNAVEEIRNVSIATDDLITMVDLICRY